MDAGLGCGCVLLPVLSSTFTGFASGLASGLAAATAVAGLVSALVSVLSSIFAGFASGFEQVVIHPSRLLSQAHQASQTYHDNKCQPPVPMIPHPDHLLVLQFDVHAQIHLHRIYTPATIRWQTQTVTRGKS